VYIVQKLVEGFNPYSEIKSFVDNLDGSFSIYVCDTINIREGSSFKINSTSFVAKKVDLDLKKITYNSLVAPVVGDNIFGATPFFWHGTPIAVGNELQRILQSENKLPMVYLYEIITDEFDNDSESAIDRESSLRLFFLDEANFADWDTDEHYSGAIIPMASYAEALLKYLEKNSGVGEIKNFSMSYYAKFGLNIKVNSGHVQNLFPENVSGVEVRFTLPILKKLSCEC
jgi:hypothetical protein